MIFSLFSDLSLTTVVVGDRFHIYRGSYVVHLALKVIVVGTVVGSHLGHC